MDTHHLRKQSFFEAMDLLRVFGFNHPEQVRRFIHEAEDLVVFSPRL